MFKSSLILLKARKIPVLFRGAGISGEAFGHLVATSGIRPRGCGRMHCNSKAVRFLRVLLRIFDSDPGPDSDVLRSHRYLLIFDPDSIFKQAGAGQLRRNAKGL